MALDAADRFESPQERPARGSHELDKARPFGPGHRTGHSGANQQRRDRDKRMILHHRRAFRSARCLSTTARARRAQFPPVQPHSRFEGRCSHCMIDDVS